MMTADEYRAKAEEIAKMADAASSYDMVLEWEALAREWVSLAQLADWQDLMETLLK